MSYTIHQHLRLFFLALFVFLIFFTSKTDSQPSNTLSRAHTPVIIKAESLPLFLGIPVDQICIARYLYDINQWEAIPFQIDELDGSNSFFGDKNNKLDADDEIVFLVKDIGDSAIVTEWIDDDEAQDYPRYQLAIKDPLFPSQQGWIYIYQSFTYPKSGIRYLQVNEVEDRVESDTYQIIHGSTGLQHDLFLKLAAGGDEIDFLDRQKLRLKAKVNLPSGLGSITLTLTEEYNKEHTVAVFFKLRVKVYKKDVEYTPNHEIRVHRNLILEASAKVSGIIDEKVELPFISTFYPTFSEWAPKALDLSELGSWGSIKLMRVTTDLNENSVGMIFYNNYNPGGIRIDGITSAYNDTLDWPGNNTHLIMADPSYIGALINQSSIVTLTSFEGDPISTVQEFYFNDNSSSSSSDTGDKRSYGETGVEISSSNITGVLDYYTASFYLPENINLPQANSLTEEHVNSLVVQYQEEYVAYDLIAQVDPPEAGWVEISGSTSKDSTVIITAHHYPGYIFNQWSGDITGSDTTITLIMDSPKTITAHFRTYRDITVTSVPPGLFFDADSETFYTPHTFTWLEGDTHSLCFDSLITESVRISRYQFHSWSHSAKRCHDYLVPEENQILTATFTKQFHLTTLINPQDGGTITKFPDKDWFDDHDSVTLEAFPAGDLVFLSWAGSISDTTNPISVLMDTAKVIVARFGNLPPMVHFPDTSFNEDDTLNISYQQLYLWISDNSSDTTLSIEFSNGNYLKVTMDTNNKFVKISSKQKDWNGIDTLMISITDPIGFLVADTFYVTVHPIPDPPGPFSLLNPADGSMITEWSQEIDFSWEPSLDPDQEDTITYIFELDTSKIAGSSPIIRIGNLKETTIDLSLPVLDWGKFYYWRVQAIDQTGRSTWSLGTFALDLTTLVKPESHSTLPNTYLLTQNYPNPFNGITKIHYGLPVSNQISLMIYNSSGQRVKNLFQGIQKAGYHKIRWDGSDQRGFRVSTGVYFIVFQTDTKKIVKKAILLQ